MTVSTLALTQFRRRSLEVRDERVLPACFVLDADMSVAAGVVASFRPASMLQIHGGVRCTSDATVARTIEHAVEALGVRTVVVCAEDGLPPRDTGRSERLLADLTTLTDHLWLGRLFREAGVEVEALWLDRVEGDIHRWRPGRGFELLGDGGLAALVHDIHERAGSAR